MSIGVEGVEDGITAFVCSTSNKSLRIVSVGIKGKVPNDDTGTHSDVVVWVTLVMTHCVKILCTQRICCGTSKL